MTHEEAFLQAILEHPDDDAPRLVYADWLEEHGASERAAFIRLHIELARMAPDDSRCDEVRRKLGPMLHGQQAAWRARLGRGVNGLRLARGFAEGVHLTAANWLRRGRRLLEAAPIRELTLSEAGPQVEALAAAATLARLTALDLSRNELGDGAARALAGSPHLGNLTSLSLTRNHLGPEGAAALAGSAHLAGLTSLELSGNPLGDDGARALAGSPHLTGLRELHLGSCDIGDPGARALAASPALGHVRELILFVNRISGAGAEALAGSPHLKHLSKLYLNQNPIGPAKVKALQQRLGDKLSWTPAQRRRSD